MEIETHTALTGSDEDEAYRALITFNEKNAKVFKFTELSLRMKQRLVHGTMTWLNASTTKRATRCACLETVRVISRDRSDLDTLMTPDLIDCLVRHAELIPANAAPANSEPDYKVIFEAQQCLCNIIFNCNTAQHICSNNQSIEGIVQRLKTYRDSAIPFDIKLLDMRMLFLLTSLCPDVRGKVRTDLHGMTYLIEVLDLNLRRQGQEEGEGEREGEGEGEGDDQTTCQSNFQLTNKQITLCSEILKILYSLTVTIERNNLDEEEEAHFMRLVSILHELLLCKTESQVKSDTIISNTVNLLTNMPRSSYEELLTPLPDSSRKLLYENKTTSVTQDSDVFDGKSMQAIVSLLSFLERRIDQVNTNPSTNLIEDLGPVLYCLIEVCQSHRCIRRFCRVRVLPTLASSDVQRLPDEGVTLRNRICKLLSCNVGQVKTLSAEFLFVLCKENVSRFIKYTGYGNAAGLLAERGLMGGVGGGPSSSSSSSPGGARVTDYSSESDDSDTEDYANIRESVNPVTGRAEPYHVDIMAGMSDEQKEYEAMKLVQQIDKLQSQGQ